MKGSIILTSVCLISANLFAQYNNKFDLLNGFEDSTGVTHLTFTFSTTDSLNYAWPDCPPVYLTFVDVIHFNTATLMDSVLITNNAQNGMCGMAGRYFSEIKAINNDPENFVAVGSYGDGFEPYGYLHFLATDAQVYPLFEAFKNVFLDSGRPDTVFINKQSEDRSVLAIPVIITQSHLSLINYGSYDVPDDTARK